jgi:hypothetical protein
MRSREHRTTRAPAAPDRFMSHLAIREASLDGGPDTEWGELVSDAEDGGPARDAHA